MVNIKFFKGSTSPNNITEGGVWFDTTTGSIKVKTETGYDTFGIGVKDATLSSGILTITKADNNTITIDFNDIASATSVAAALDKKVDKGTNINAGEGLTGGGNLAYTRVISHAVPTTESEVTTSGFYKIATDKFGHVTATTAVAKSDVTALGIPGSDTTYTFTGGENKITVTPSTGTAINVEITPKILDNVVKKGGVTTGNLPKYADNTGAIENGYSVDGTLSNSTGAIPTSAAVSNAIESKIAAANAMIFKGTIGTEDTNTTLPTKGYKTGWTYKVATAGTYAGIVCEVGDMLIALKDGPTSGTSVINDDWTVVQANIDGAVTGPTSSTDGHIAVFNGATGKIVKDSGLTIKTSVPANALFTDTTYTFAGGNGSFTVTPKNGSAQTISIGKPSTAGTADKVANNFTVTLNGGATEGTDKFTYNGSGAKTMNLNASSFKLSSSFTSASVYSAPSAADTVETAISKLTKGVADASAGVTSFGGETGAITVRGEQTTNINTPVVELSMSGNELQATLKNVATLAQGRTAENSLQKITAQGDSYLNMSVGTKVSNTQNISGTLVIQSVASASNTAKGLVEASDVKTYIDSMMVWYEFN